MSYEPEDDAPEVGADFADPADADEELLDGDLDDDLDDAENLLFFSSLEEFVTEYLANLIRRRLNRSVAVWCPEWWQHPEAVVRLSAMWRSFEHLRRDPALGMSTWWLHHVDPHMRMLMDPDYGPFVQCDAREGHSDRPPEALPVKPVPEGLLSSPAFTVEDSLTKRMQREGTDAAPTDAAASSREGFVKDQRIGMNMGL